MRIYNNIILFGLVITTLFSCTISTAPLKILAVEQLDGAPRSESGYELGVSAQFAGMLGGHIAIAGGCNFPGIPAAEGGAKRFYKGVYIADTIVEDWLLKWRKVGELLAPSAYGVAIPIDGKIVIIGGSDGKSSLSSVYSISLTQNDSITVDSLPSLPYTMDNMAGAIIDSVIFLVGGNVGGVPSNKMISLDLDSLQFGWRAEEPFPYEARTQLQLVACSNDGFDDGSRDDDALYLFGGFAYYGANKKPTLSTSSLCYSLNSRKWSSVATPISSDSVAVSLGGGCSVALGGGFILSVGGVNKDIFERALLTDWRFSQATISGDIYNIDSLKAIKNEYLMKSATWYEFNDKAMLYDTKSDKWFDLGSHNSLARAGAAIVNDKGLIYNIGGELKPGVRSPKTSKITLGSNN